MLKKIFTNTYVISGIIVFVLMFAILLYLKVSMNESLFASAVLAVVGMAVVWWQKWGW
jgi:hypothetical protein